MKATRPRRIPQRTRVGCRQVQGKRELVRVVRTPEGEVVVDPTGKRNGRGAYVHATRDCFDLALRRGGIERGLKTSLTPEARRALEAIAQSLPSAPPEGEATPADT
jgi:predicted RNA-binding protein YlxR (DUF448 family)